MKIAEISAFSQYSVGKIMLDIKNYIEENTNDICKVFYARGKKSDAKGVIKYGNEFLFTVNCIFARIFDNDGFCLSLMTRRLIKKLEEFNPDIIHIHCLHGYYMNSRLLFNYFKKKNNVKIIWTMHDSWCLTGHCCFFERIKCQKWIKGCYKCELKHSYPKTVLLDKSKSNYVLKRKIFTSLDIEKLKIVCPSNWLKSFFLNSNYNKYEIKTIFNGLDTNIFNNYTFIDNSSNSNKKVLLGVASVWDERKGIDYFMKLSRILPCDWKIVLIGKLKKKYVFPINITHIERTENQHVLREYYRKANVFFNPTLDDTFSLVNLEAQACGTKVLCFDSGGCSDSNIGNLYLTKEKNINNLMEEIIRLDEQKNNDVDYVKASSKRMAREYYNLFLDFK